MMIRGQIDHKNSKNPDHLFNVNEDYEYDPAQVYD